MWYASLVLAVCCMFIVSFQNVAAAEYEPVGCFKDRKIRRNKSRTLPELLHNFRDSNFDWTNFTKTIDACAELTKKKGYFYFGIQYYGECWSGPHGHLTYNRDNSSIRCTKGVGKAHTNFVYRLPTGKENECLDYKLLDTADRSMNLKLTPGRQKCDHWTFGFQQRSWFRFDGQAGTAMADTCVQPRRCQTYMSGWMNGSIPMVDEGIQSRQVCYSWGNKCCSRHEEIFVRNCGRFTVYKLPGSKGCYQRYCGNGEVSHSSSSVQ